MGKQPGSTMAARTAAEHVEPRWVWTATESVAANPISPPPSQSATEILESRVAADDERRLEESEEVEWKGKDSRNVEKEWRTATRKGNDQGGECTHCDDECAALPDG